MRKMLVNQLEQVLDDDEVDSIQDIYQERRTTIKTSNEWNAWRGAFATQMFTQWQYER